eukprot:284815460_4
MKIKKKKGIPNFFKALNILNTQHTTTFILSVVRLETDNFSYSIHCKVILHSYFGHSTFFDCATSTLIASMRKRVVNDTRTLKCVTVARRFFSVHSIHQSCASLIILHHQLIFSFVSLGWPFHQGLRIYLYSRIYAKQVNALSGCHQDCDPQARSTWKMLRARYIHSACCIRADDWDLFSPLWPYSAPSAFCRSYHMQSPSFWARFYTRCEQRAVSSTFKLADIFSFQRSRRETRKLHLHKPLQPARHGKRCFACIWHPSNN